jgi:hypothetical protein
MCGTLVHTHRSAFFSAPAKCDDHGQGVTEETPNLGHRKEAGESVDVLKSLEFAHPRIVTSSQGLGKGVPPEKNRGLATLKSKKLPTRFREEPV